MQWPSPKLCKLSAYFDMFLPTFDEKIRSNGLFSVVLCLPATPQSLTRRFVRLAIMLMFSDGALILRFVFLSSLLGFVFNQALRGGSLWTLRLYSTIYTSSQVQNATCSTPTVS